MQDLLVWLGLFIVAGATYAVWNRRERRRHRAHEEVAEDVAALGDDLVPGSIHPVVDPDRCMGSGACIEACPEHDVIGFIEGRAALINPLACVGHGACAAACPVQAIQLVFGTAKRGIELPRVGADFQTSKAGVYIAGELGGMGLIRNAVEQGRQAAANLVKAGRRGREGELDAVVVGAGPAGISAALGLVEAGLRIEVIEAEELGGTIRHYPRAKVVMTGALHFPRWGKVKRRTMSKEELVTLWEEIHAGAGLPITTGQRVEGLRADGAAWVVRTREMERRAANVVLALGRRGVPRKLGVPGEERGKVFYRLLEPTVFAGQHVLVVGGGNAAAESCISLAEDGGCASVTLSYRRAELVRLRRSVRDRIGQLIEAGKVKAMMPSEVLGIAEQAVTLRLADKSQQEIANDAVIVQIGGTAPGELLTSFGIEMVEKRGEA